MGSRFGHDFSQVRVHTDAKAAASAKAVHAVAYTVGQDIVFGEGQYVPHTHTGLKVLAHKLTHTIQQSGSLDHRVRTLSVGVINGRVCGNPHVVGSHRGHRHHLLNHNLVPEAIL
jgi:Domain of unknown function (DUF4157)